MQFLATSRWQPEITHTDTHTQTHTDTHTQTQTHTHHLAPSTSCKNINSACIYRSIPKRAHIFENGTEHVQQVKIPVTKFTS